MELNKLNSPRQLQKDIGCSEAWKLISNLRMFHLNLGQCMK